MNTIVKNAAAVAALLLGASAFAQVQAWKPERHVELIVPAGAGGSLDTTGRTVHRLWEQLKLVPATSTVSNRAGGGHSIAYAYLNQRAGDPHFLSITSQTILAGHINGRLKTGHRDVTPLATLVTEYIAFAVRPDSPLKSGRDLVEALAKDPGSLSVALSSATGGTHHIALGLPLQSANVDVRRVKVVAFNSSSDAVAAVLGGHVDVVSGSTINIAAQAKAGKLRVLAVSSPKRLPGDFAAVPTWPEQGLKGIFENWRGVIGARGMTPEQTAYWENVLAKVAESEDFQQYAAKNMWAATFLGAAPMRAMLDSQYDELKGVMNFLGLVK